MAVKCASVPLVGANTASHVGAAEEGFSSINTTPRQDNCTACTTAKIINQMERLAGEDALTANQIESKYGYTGKERKFSVPKSLAYIEDATGLKGSHVGFNEGDVGHYAVFPRVGGEGFGHVIYGEVLPDGTRYLYDAQIGKTMSWTEMLDKYTGGAKAFHLKPE